jgi:hypothetical protein
VLHRHSGVNSVVPAIVFACLRPCLALEAWRPNVKKRR